MGDTVYEFMDAVMMVMVAEARYLGGYNISVGVTQQWYSRAPLNVPHLITQMIVAALEACMCLPEIHVSPRCEFPVRFALLCIVRLIP
jgi:hypothetical protein